MGAINLPRCRLLNGVREMGCFVDSLFLHTVDPQTNFTLLYTVPQDK